MPDWYSIKVWVRNFDSHFFSKVVLGLYSLLHYSLNKETVSVFVFVFANLSLSRVYRVPIVPYYFSDLQRKLPNVC